MRRRRYGTRRCRYGAAVTEVLSGPPPRRVLARCTRRNVLGSSGWHLHSAPLPLPGVRVHRGVRLRWRSTSAPDYDARGAE